MSRKCPRKSCAGSSRMGGEHDQLTDTDGGGDGRRGGCPAQAGGVAGGGGDLDAPTAPHPARSRLRPRRGQGAAAALGGGTVNNNERLGFWGYFFGCLAGVWGAILGLISTILFILFVL